MSLVAYRVALGLAVASLTLSMAQLARAQVAHDLSRPGKSAALAFDVTSTDAVSAQAPSTWRSRAARAPLDEVARRSPSMRISPGSTGDARLRTPSRDAGRSQSQAEPTGIDAPRNYGSGSEDTPYHYTEMLVAKSLQGTYPYRATGKFFFQQTSDPASWRWCTGSLISNSVLLVAGHCVHRGVGGANGWIKAGVFYPGYFYGQRAYGRAVAEKLFTTTRWFNQGDGNGADIGIVVLSKRAGKSHEIGEATGYWPFCWLNCHRSYWHHSRLSYPGNYEGGEFLVQGHSLSIANGFGDLLFGSGAQSGVSGSPLVSNLGFLGDDLTDKGRSPDRNVIMGVATYVFDPAVKRVGGSTTTNIGNANGFKALFNQACQASNTLHGTGSCTPLP